MPHATLDSDLLGLCFGGIGASYDGGGGGGDGGDFSGNDLGSFNYGGGEESSGGDFVGSTYEGGDTSYSFDDGSTVTYGETVTSTEAVEPGPTADPADAMIDAMSPETPDWDQPQPDIDTTGVVPYEMSEADAAAQQHDLNLNYRDTASPPEIFQGSSINPADPAIGNCTTIAVVNGMLAQGGMEYIQSIMSTNPDGSVTFALPGGNQTVYPGYDNYAWSPNGPSDPAVLYATALAYQLDQVPTLVDSNAAVVEHSLEGRYANEVMEVAGFTNITSADGPGAPGAVQVADGPIPGMPDSAHSYQVIGNDYANPWGYQHGLTDVQHSFGGDPPQVQPQDPVPADLP